MSRTLFRLVETLQDGNVLAPELAAQLADGEQTESLTAAADNLRRLRHGSTFYACGIVNARSGGCSEDCRFCGQSAQRRGATGARAVMIEPGEVCSIADQLEHHGIARLSLVTSGRAASSSTLDALSQLYGQIRRGCNFTFCASAGLLKAKGLEALRRAGVERYHCNLETAPSYFPAICSSHTLDDKVNTLRFARQAGLSLCSGGIIGLGESMHQRIELALTLRSLAVDSVPLNIMTPLPGTPLEGRPVPLLDDILRSIAIFRLMLPNAVLRMAGGRQQLGEKQYLCFLAGANGAIVGNYLTTQGNPLEKDLEAIRRLGYKLESRQGSRA